MLKIEKKIVAELNRLEGYLYDTRKPVDGWMAKKSYYKNPAQYEDETGEWFSLPAKQHIGDKDLTVFLKNTIALDEDYRGRTAVLLLKVGGEAVLSINGAHYNGLDYNREMIMLSPSANGDETYQVEIESYCKDLILDSANFFKADVVITQSELAAIYRPAWDCYYDLKTTYDFICGCQEEYTRQRVLRLIYDTFLMLDYAEETALEGALTTAHAYFRAGIAKFEELKLPVTMYFAGHSHIDVAWHWPLKETVRKVSRTFSSMLRLMEQYEDFKFCQSMPVLYEMARDYYPELVAQVKERVKEGRWETLGSMYLEPDCNLISGESFVRQIMYGKKFYQEELGADSNICFLPDVFGYSSAMPQILKKAGTDYFFTTKLTWNETNEFPYSVFKWRGLDGTEILSGMMSMCTQRGLGLYNGDMSAKGIRLSMDHFKNKGSGDPILYLYGHGDGGGGVTKEMLETVTRLNRVPLLPKVEFGTVGEYFAALDPDKEYPVWSGELYFEKHRGTYTTAANNKKNNRRSEFLYRDAELFAVWQYLYNDSFKDTRLEAGWKKIMLNQFHDILPGTCIAEVYEQCDRDYKEIREIGEQSIRENLEGLLEKGTNSAAAGEYLTVFNTLSWERTGVITVSGTGKNGGTQIVRDSEGRIPVQVRREDGTITVLAEQIPALGYRTYLLSDGQVNPANQGAEHAVQSKTGIVVINEYFIIKLDNEGEIISLFDRMAQREVLKSGRSGNHLKLQDDIPVEWGAAWETTTKREDRPSLPFTTTKLFIKEDHEIYTIIRVEKDVHTSKIAQDLIIYHHEPLIEFATTVDWDELHKILRVEFPVAINSLTARYDVAFGNSEHPNHGTTSFDEARFEVCGHKWGDVSDGSYGVSLLNDCKYGYSIQNSDMALSLLRSSNHPSDARDRGIHTFSYFIKPHTGSIKEGQVARAGYEVNVPLRTVFGRMPEDCRSFVRVDQESVIIDTVKPAEDGDGIIVRLFETYNTAGQGKMEFSFPVTACVETDLLERMIETVPVQDNSIEFKVNPYEIKTYRIRR